MPTETILVADDDQGILDLLNEILEREGYRVFHASNGKEAVQITQDNPIDVVILDWKMPVMDGLEALKDIKAFDQNIEVLMMTAYTDVDSVDQMLDHGAYDYIVKPFHKTDVTHTVQNALLKREFISQNDRLKKDLKDRVIQLEKQFEKRTRQLRKSQIRYKQIIEYSNDAIVVAQDGMLKFVNPKALELTGYTEEEIQKLPFTDLIYPEDRRMVEESHYRRLEGEDLPSIYTFRVLRKDGESFWVEINAIMTPWDGKPATLNVLRDITDRKSAEEALRESEGRARSLLNTITEMVILVDTEGTILDLNETAAQILRGSVEELLGVCLYYLFPPSLAASRKAAADGVIRTGAPVRTEDECEGRIYDCHWYPISTAKGEVVQLAVFAVDITDRRKVEGALMRAQKLESIGILAGGIAHDFNNILAAIMGSVSLAKAEVKPEDSVYELLDEAEKASSRAKAIAQRLLTFSQGGAPVKKVASIKDVIMESADFALRGSKARCDYTIPEGIWPVQIDVDQISQVINNLIINAVHSMPDGGIIQLSAENTMVDANDGLSLDAGRYLKISVKDQGIGIKEENLLKIFDPYFTTNQTGTGLGLATAYSIIKRHDGQMTVESKPDVGTTFHIYLPASEKEIPEPTEEGERLLEGRGRVLLMDDEESVRKIAGQMLQRLGYEVQCAKDGVEGIALYEKAKESGEPFDAVIMDLTIPGGMGGKDAVRNLLKIDPEVKAIVSSGYSNDQIMSNFKEFGFSGMVAKPYKLHELGEALHQVTSEKA